MKINLRREDYYTQNNNRFLPTVACMPTARAMFYVGNKIPFEVPDGEGADDYFMRLLRSQEAWEFCRKKYPWTTHRNDSTGRPLSDVPPNEVHGMYGSWLDERVTGCRRTNFVTDLSYERTLELVDSGRVIMTSGRFPNTSGHAVCIVGSMCDGVLLLADPHGDYRSGYRSEDGYLVPFSAVEFRARLSGNNTGKWAHLLLEDV